MLLATVIARQFQRRAIDVLNLNLNALPAAFDVLSRIMRQSRAFLATLLGRLPFSSVQKKPRQFFMPIITRREPILRARLKIF